MRKYRYYEILEVSRDASQDDVNAAFRRRARQWHPDRNPGNTEAEATFRRVNTAYQVLGNEASRAEYDRSAVECPTCGTHEVMGLNDHHWQCKHCGCRFDISGAPEIQAIDAPNAPPLRRLRFRAFQATQCSWCAKFYDREPFLCPHSKPATNCESFKALTENERKAYLMNAAMPALTDEWLRPSAERKRVRKCTACGALSPNPSRASEPCWNCHRPLRDECPLCGLPMLYYDIEQGAWRCANNQCSGRRFDFDSVTGSWTSPPPPVKQRPTGAPQRPTRPWCPNCGAGLVWSDQQEAWVCIVCRNLYTPEQAGFTAPQDGPIPVYAPKGSRRTTRRERERRARPEPRPRPEPRQRVAATPPVARAKREKTTSDYVLLALAVGLIMIIGTVIIMGMTGKLG